jgi:uncharacterized protein (TIGR02421 family)
LCEKVVFFYNFVGLVEDPAQNEKCGLYCHHRNKEDVFMEKKRGQPKSKLTAEEAVIHRLSERVVKAQNPIRILDAIKWDEKVEKQFFKTKCKELPKVDAEYYLQHQPLRYNPEKKIDEFFQIEHDIRKNLGTFSGVSKIMQRMCREYREVVMMMESRGKPAFSKISQQLYGSSEDAFYVDAPTLNDLACAVSKTLDNIQDKAISKQDEKIYTAKQSIEILGPKLERYFTDMSGDPRVIVSDDIVADAAAGAETIKMNQSVMFSKRALRQLEVHEGWVHLGTTLNGKRQPICTFLSKGAPSSTVTQEGLAILVEILTFSSFPSRVRRITDRVRAVNMAEDGADFLDVFKYFESTGNDSEAAYKCAVRAFRGSVPNGKPFTKDLSYVRGFVEIFNYIRLAIGEGLVSHIPMLFCGKTALEDLRLIVDLVDQGLVKKPKYVPPQFKDVGAICAWAAFSLFVNKLDPDEIAKTYQGLLRR